ncbi:oligosaccharide flippase family protein [Bradyrhizobium sp. CB3481]|uniref:oligosaccharide flippase family protein n=1 Tax=Bradyrhizobium sp. CB3481 TaxID=3039158 RepID=UPI0024B27BFE|nr:oligosaccharide flippase family protein [Bradyrhizobium sp. CB3481]WFU18785.1 oligosaccharide flippase family protein [Bradyrhizobium sp. CB3481]
MNVINRTALRQRVLAAGLWSLAGYAFSMIIRFGSNLLMTRLLMPETFGIMAIASTVMIGLAMFSDLGLKQFVVQSARGSEQSYLNTAWVIQILRGVVLWGASIVLSGLLAGFGYADLIPAASAYASPVLPWIVVALCFSTVISGFSSTKMLEASRGLSLGFLTRLEIAAQLVGLVCMIVWALVDRSIWSLVAGSLAATAARTWLSHVWLPGVRNRWEWDKAAASEILHFGKWIFLASILGFLASSGDQLILGGLVNSTILGLYVVANLYVSTADGVLTRIMGDVSFPAFSEVVRERRTDLKQTYYKFHNPIAAVAYVSGGVLCTFGQALVSLLYDSRYEYSGSILGILSLILFTVPFRLSTQSFLALGVPKLQSNIVLLRLVFLVILTPGGFYFFGFIGSLWGIVISHFSYLPLIISYNFRHGLFDLRKEIYLLAFVPAGLAAGSLLSLLIGYVK